ncbi:transglutaminase-like cysteine peptidase [Xanthobacter agilis]|uniref:Transglutaminase-like cysteine proteinase n=1 Tax=Xanthobacter agilis TaxID=47492 RepID=A0ABU0LAT5_XANAG|nr:transglutaminase-like cysteine peptidase [Xanthobacter agilis]MDQ0504244.1 putative transglutaminase-like cysteine proteinase [Xanthobacter agilis]
MSKRLPQTLLQILLTMALLYAGFGPATAQEQRFANLSPAFAPRHLADGRATSAPAGYTRFCAEHPRDCGISGAHVAVIHLDEQKVADIDRVNRGVNARIQPETDLEHYGETERWAYPDDGKGDCEDYVLEKRRTLLNLGWPGSALLITVVRDREGDGHAVLTVVTDHGDLILDNQEDEILSWKETGYRYVKRQSQARPSEWVSLGETLVPSPPVVGGGR